MHQPDSWLFASLLLVAVAVYLAWSTHRTLRRRIERADERARDISDLHLATMEALALAIDAKDQTARNHIRRVQVYSTGIARALGMNDLEVEAVNVAALLHDIGKLAVPDHILAKPGPLTAEELQRVRVHPQVGAAIISGIPFRAPVAPLIASHHERWDGRGYPAQLRGEEIPLGARILGLVDYFDALTSDRPYHAAMPLESALELLQLESGKALDPKVVDAFLAVRPVLREDAESGMYRLPQPWPVRRPHGDEAVAAAAVPHGPSPVLEEISGAHREIYALYQVAQAMGTSLGVREMMEQVASRLAPVVPFSAAALFLYDDATDTLQCTFASGIEADAIKPLVLRRGQGLTGWVARNRCPVVNARPSADFEAAASTVTTSLQSALVCPLMVGDQLIGTLGVYHTTPGFYRNDHRRLLEGVCDQASAVVRNAIVFEQTQEASFTDALTGLPNTRFMRMYLTRELSRAERLKSEVTLLICDLDGFKRINDTCGHQAGDSALRQVAIALRDAVRPYDVCARYAGDEFILVLAGCGPDEAHRKCVELQHIIATLAFESHPGEILRLTISAGAAVFPHDGATYEALLAVADERMYRNKTEQKERDAATRTDADPPVAPRDLGRANGV